MSRGSRVMLSSNPKGQFMSGIAGDSLSMPGNIMQVKAATERIGNQFTFILAAPGTDGKKVLAAILLDDAKNGFLMGNSTTTVGQQIEMYVPAPGEEINVRVGETAGTGNSFAIGDRLEANASGGYLIPESTGTQAPFICLETITQTTADQLTWCVKT